MRRYPNAGDIVRIEMVRCGYTLQSLSEATAISQAVLREILTGRAESVSTRNVCAMAAAFDYPVAVFIDLLSDPAAARDRMSDSKKYAIL